MDQSELHAAHAGTMSAAKPIHAARTAKVPTMMPLTQTTTRATETTILRMAPKPQTVKIQAIVILMMPPTTTMTTMGNPIESIGAYTLERVSRGRSRTSSAYLRTSARWV
ncbi:hypothetical protein K469DRAFT_248812 [Zopfia rhizophila CBS 207.26]|uniref:Uncharacterized protein n=1 Tax=Zopfia rhizophila CBS 207.26 TaxID=1314779 RepID=A0A6A6DUJ3_9PEZI|nr:hypothetical protein K469DRAFT_248812 [Zopfia rhizophila CBS 207.26]